MPFKGPKSNVSCVAEVISVRESWMGVNDDVFICDGDLKPLERMYVYAVNGVKPGSEQVINATSPGETINWRPLPF